MHSSLDENKMFSSLSVDTVTYEKYVFGLCPPFWHRGPKILGISCFESHKRVFRYVNEVAFKSPKDGGLVARETKHIRRWNS